VASAARKPWAARLFAALAGLLLLTALRGAAAHPMPESRVWIDTTAEGARLTLQLPLNRLEYGFGAKLSEAPGSVLALHGQALSQYLLRHVALRSGGTPWQAEPPQLRIVGDDASAELHAVIEWLAPPGADARAPTLVYDAVTHEVRTHRALVFLRSDWAGGRVGEPPQPVGELRYGVDTLALTLGEPRAGAGVLRLIRGGALHIAEGADHLAFLLMLLLAAPLSVVAGRWGPAWPARRALREAAWVVSAFTLGHSVTLALGSSGLLQPPAARVEVAVALTVAAAAVHALRPLFANAQAWMALAFGLVHGFAFSSALSGAGLTTGQHALALLSFNLGIEAMQLIAIALVLPPLVLIASRRPHAFAHVRRLVAGCGLLLALLWTAQRLDAPAAFSLAWLDAGAAWAWALPLALWAAAACALRAPRAA
jgi:hypothetical protein